MRTMSSSASKLLTPRRVQQLVSWAIVLLVVFITGRTVWREQQTALDQCAPECDLVGVATAGAETVFAGAIAVPTYSAWGLPVGIGLSILFLLWLLQFVHVDRV